MLDLEPATHVLKNMTLIGAYSAGIGCVGCLVFSTPLFPAVLIRGVSGAVLGGVSSAVREIAKNRFSNDELLWVGLFPGVVAYFGAYKFTAAKLALGASAAPLAAQVLGVTFVALNVLLLLNSLITPALSGNLT